MSDDFPKHKTTDRYRRRKKIIPTIITIAAMLSLVSASYALYQGTKNDSDTQENVGGQYAHADLGASCAEGVSNYDKKLDSLYSKLNGLTAELEAASDLPAQAQERTDQTWAAINSVMDVNKQQYEDGIISLDELNRRNGEKLDFAVRQGVVVEKEAQEEMQRIMSDVSRRGDKVKEEIDAATDGRTKLESCANHASARGEFAVSDVADFQALVVDSKRQAY